MLFLIRAAIVVAGQAVDADLLCLVQSCRMGILNNRVSYSVATAAFRLSELE